MPCPWLYILLLFSNLNIQHLELTTYLGLYILCIFASQPVAFF